MAEPLSTRNYLRIRDAARLLGVTEQTLRNWDRLGKLSAFRHPVNGYRLYRVAEMETLLREFRAAPPPRSLFETPADPFEVSAESSERQDGQLPACHWSPSVALDPKHRPQEWRLPASTVRRDWRKFPQEAHVLSEDGRRYRRLSPAEIAALQGFPEAIFDGLNLTERERIGVLGDAVPSPLSRALFAAIAESKTWEHRSALEICAGVGGLAEGESSADFEHLALVDFNPVCVEVLRNARPWRSSIVHHADVRAFDFSPFAGRVGILSGGPPCQPWSRSGRGLGGADQRDLLGWLPRLLATVRPEAFVFENVPGLLAETHRDYLSDVVDRLRRPSPELRYGALVASFDAADFGVAQHRQRVFLVGFRNAPATLAHECFDDLAGRRTHADPVIAGEVGLLPWVSVGDVLSHRADPGGWRRWIGS